MNHDALRGDGALLDAYRDRKLLDHYVEPVAIRYLSLIHIYIYKARARHFQVMGNKLMPSINSIDGLGEKAADSIEEAAKDCLLYTSRCV